MYWQVKLVNGQKFNELDDKFDIAWELPDTVESVELMSKKDIGLGIAAKPKFSCNLKKGSFSIDGETFTPECPESHRTLILRKRVKKQLKIGVDPATPEPEKVYFVIGFTCVTHRFELVVDMSGKVISRPDNPNPYLVAMAKQL